jgi:hypothetical protein
MVKYCGVSGTDPDNLPVPCRLFHFGRADTGLRVENDAQGLPGAGTAERPPGAIRSRATGTRLHTGGSVSGCENTNAV